MYSLVLHGRRLVELQKLRDLRFAVSLFQKESAFSSSFSSASVVAADLTLRDGRKGKNFTVSYLVKSLGLATKVAESISRRVSFVEKANPDSVLKLLRSHGFTNSQISTIIVDSPRLLVADAEKALAPKLQFLQSIGASTSELTEIISTVPKILRKKEGKCISRYYVFVKEIIEADKSSKFGKLCRSSLPQGKQENKLRNVSALRELGVPQKRLFPLLIAVDGPANGKEKFKESLKKVVEMGFNPASATFILALRVVQGFRDETIEEKMDVYERLGLAKGDVLEMFKKCPLFLTHSEKKITNTMETFLGLGFTGDEFRMIVKGHPPCFGLSAETVKKKTEFLVKQMDWPLRDIAVNPMVLGFSMENRLVPRCNVIKALMSKGLLGSRGSKLPPMQSTLKCTDEDFLNRYVRKHDDKELVSELMSIFTGDSAS